MAQKRRLLRVNEHFKPFLNDVLAILVVMLRSHRRTRLMSEITVGPIPQVDTRSQPEQPLPKVIVVGAGISGLASAWFLQRQGFEVLVLEAGGIVGGNLQTHKMGTCQFERGPNSFINNRPAMAELIAGAGLTDELVYAQQAAHKRYVAKHGRLVALPTHALQF